MLRALLNLDRNDPKPDVAVSAFRFETKPKRRPAGPAHIGPAAAPPHARKRTSGIAGTGYIVQIGIDAAGRAVVIPVAAPFEDVADHVIHTPGVRLVLTHLAGSVQCGAQRSAVVRCMTEKVSLRAAQ